MANGGKIFNRDVRIGGGGSNAGLYVNDILVIDGSGNIDAPVTTTNLTTSGNTTLGDASGDTITLNGTTTASAPVTVGVDDTGHDVKFFGATSGAHLLWDESADELKLVGGASTNMQGTLTVGVDDTGYDVQFFGATASANMLWDESADSLKLQGDAGFIEDAKTLTANTDEGAASSIPAGKRSVAVTGVNADANDFIVLPAIANVPIGHTITIACNASSNFELRTPSTSNTTINGVDSDGDQEYLCTDTDVVVVTKATATGWIGVSYTSAGAVRTAVVPD